ncbi:MAG TPA: hypothetical protein VGX76_14415 [Pirellulales bacterium]|jgi:hypothetical protein|nr:hypothetical protein [Pirellulales bacterium]
MKTKASQSQIELRTILAGLDGTQQLAVFAVINLGVMQSVGAKAMSPDQATQRFCHAGNCLYVKRRLKNKLADEVMSRGVQLADLFEALPPARARTELANELHAMRALCLKLLRPDKRQTARQGG